MKKISSRNHRRRVNLKKTDQIKRTQLMLVTKTFENERVEDNDRR